VPSTAWCLQVKKCQQTFQFEQTKRARQSADDAAA
jgi:hypothetical protein